MTDISDRVNDVEQEQQAKAGVKESPLEKKTNRGFFRKLIEFGYMTATTVAATAIAGPLNLLSVTGSYLLAHTILHRKKLKYEGLRKELHLGNAMTVLLYKIFGLYNIMFKGNILLNSAFILGVGIPVFNVLFIAARHFIYNYTPLKLVKDTLTFKLGTSLKDLKQTYKKDYFPMTKRTYLVSPIMLGAVNFVPFKYQLPITSVGRLAYRLALGKSGKDQKNSYDAPKPYKTATQPT